MSYGPAAHAAVTADGVVKAKNGVLYSVLLTAGDAAAGSIILYDNASAASGTILATLKAAQGTTVQWSPGCGYVFTNGIYADIGGASAAAYVVYQ
ncbi:MAG: hypothetical protein IPK63_15885 [Candidatus Competibacteraceae bacterium]|nr:hypothetical protein [Candidatus Competibacteraceae bacterium]